MRILTENAKGKAGEFMSVKQKAWVVFAILVMIFVAASLLIYSITQAQSYDGIFVSGVRQVWY